MQHGQNKIGLYANRQKKRWHPHPCNSFSWSGLRKGRYDVWMPNLGPSERLLHAYHAQKLTWAKFSRQYRDELFLDGFLDKANRTIKNHGQKCTLRLLQALAKHGNITLMCHCAKDESNCHRHLLKKLLRSKI